MIRDGTLYDPIINGGSGASATATLAVSSVTLDTFGAGYTSAPTVTFGDAVGNGSGAIGTATVDNGVVIDDHRHRPRHRLRRRRRHQEVPGHAAGALQSGRRRQLPRLADQPRREVHPARRAEREVLPDSSRATAILSDEYEIARGPVPHQVLVDLPTTLVRGYVQLETPANVGHQPALPADQRAGGREHVPILTSDGSQWLGVTSPQWLGPTIAATKNKPVRIVFHNLLPTGVRRRPLPADRHHAHGLGIGPDAAGRSASNLGTRHGRGAQPGLHGLPAEHRDCFKAEPGHAAPARRHHAVDQRRHAAPVDHAGHRDHELAAGRRASRTCPT